MAYLLQPVFFLSLLALLFVLSVMAVISTARKDRQQIATLRVELEKAREEAAVKNQMYEGLKGQYDELEKDFEKASQAALNRPLPLTTAAAASPAPAVVGAAAKPAIPAAEAQPRAPVIKLDQSIADLLQKMPGSQTKTP
ncbi:MAG TPA: hypothetical protein VMD52_02220 [Patescibacteria group bacterium]|nr:hypothetical protein [Patescibacteria group bacterium]